MAIDERWIRREVAAGIATITIDRPEVRNAITREMVGRLGEHVQEVADDPAVRCIVLRGSGGHFVSGGDVGGMAAALQQAPPGRAAEFTGRATAVGAHMAALARVRKPVVSAAQGSVAGIGIGYVLVSDYVVCARDAKFTFAHVHLGIALDGLLSWFLPRVVGLGRARRYALTGATIGAEEALAAGLVSEIVGPGDVDAAVAGVSQRLVALPPAAIAAIKRQLDEADANDLAAQTALEGRLVGACAATPEFEQRVMTFVKRNRGAGERPPEA